MQGKQYYAVAVEAAPFCLYSIYLYRRGGFEHPEVNVPALGVQDSNYLYCSFDLLTIMKGKEQMSTYS
jgi:hypothetical protein